MATKSNQAASPYIALSKDDLGDLYSALYPARNRYKSFGLQIGVEIDEIENIEGMYNDRGDRLLAVLTARLRKAETLTWNDIDKILRLECVGESKLADGIRNILFGPDSSIETTFGKEGETEIENTKTGRTEESVRSRDFSMHMDKQEEVSDEEISERRVKRVKVEKYSEQPESIKSSFAKSSGNDVTEKEGKTATKNMYGESVRRKRKRIIMKKIKHKYIKARFEQKAYQWEKHERKAKRKKEVTHKKEKSVSDEFSEMASDDWESDDELDIKKGKKSKRKLQELPKIKPSKDETKMMSLQKIHTQKHKDVKEKLKSKHVLYREEKTGKHKITATGKARVEIAPDISESSDTSGSSKDDQEEHWIQQRKKKDRERKRESMSQLASGSSLSTLQQANLELPATKRQTHRTGYREKTVPSPSETDSSSAGFDVVNRLSEIENKNLIKVFRCCFGKLCCGIKDPVKIAAQLQAKRLLSRSTMETMITSPESQQVKVIALVRALDKKIKLRPDKLFAVIEVLIQNENLKETTIEMWREAGML